MKPYSIDKDIPVPKFRGNFPFKLMEVGDSFFVPSVAERRRLSVAAAIYQKKHGWKFTIRQNTEKSGLRCWRIK